MVDRSSASGRAFFSSSILSIGKRLTTPIPHTPPLSKFLPSIEFCKRTLTLTLAVITFHSQVVCAGTGMLPHLPGGFQWPWQGSALFQRMNQWTGEKKKALAFMFHAT